MKTFRYIVFSFATLFIILVCAKSWYYTRLDGGCDLRNRVIGSRLITTSHSPYFYKWNPADGQYFLDPNDPPGRFVNGNTSPPSLLWVLHPLAILDYPGSRIGWTILQFVLLSGTILLLVKKPPAGNHFISLPLVLIIIGLVCSNLWLLNIERGQVYILYAFLLALIYRLNQYKGRYGESLSGLLAGIFIWIRPLAIVTGVGFLLAKKIKWLGGCLLGLALGFLVFYLPKPALWTDYFKAMKEYGNQATLSQPAISATHYPIPDTVESMTNLQSVHDFHTGGLLTFENYGEQFGIRISPTTSYIIFALLVIGLSIPFYLLKRKTAGGDELLLFAFLLYILFELFIDAPRGGYNLIQWIFPLVIVVQKHGNNIVLMTMLTIAILLQHSFPFYFPFMFPLAELIFIAALGFAAFTKKTSNLITLNSAL